MQFISEQSTNNENDITLFDTVCISLFCLTLKPMTKGNTTLIVSSLVRLKTSFMNSKPLMVLSNFFKGRKWFLIQVKIIKWVKISHRLTNYYTVEGPLSKWERSSIFIKILICNQILKQNLKL